MVLKFVLFALLLLEIATTAFGDVFMADVSSWNSLFCDCVVCGPKLLN